MITVDEIDGHANIVESLELLGEKRVGPDASGITIVEVSGDDEKANLFVDGNVDQSLDCTTIGSLQNIISPSSIRKASRQLASEVEICDVQEANHAVNLMLG